MQGTLYDGATAFPHSVQAEVRDGGLNLSMDTGWSDRVAADVLKRIEVSEMAIRLGRTDMPGWRLILPADAAAQLAPLLGREERYGRWIDRIGLLPALAAFGAVAAARWPSLSRAAMGRAARSTKLGGNLGDAIVGDFGDNRCRNSEGQRALEPWRGIEPGLTKGPEAIRIAALDIEIFNAAHFRVATSAASECDHRDLRARRAGRHRRARDCARPQTPRHRGSHSRVGHRRSHQTLRGQCRGKCRTAGGAILHAGGRDRGRHRRHCHASPRGHFTQADGGTVRPVGRRRRQRLRCAIPQQPSVDRRGAKRFLAAFDPRARYRAALDQSSGRLFNVCSPVAGSRK